MMALIVRRTLPAFAFLTLAATSFAPAYAQDRYPSRAVTIVVPYPPAGFADLVARPLAAALERELKQPFIILNKAGAAGGIGIQSVQNAQPDGYTMLVTLSSISTLPSISAASNKPAMFARDQFTPVARLVADPCVVFVQKDAKWKDFAEFIADAKARPDMITYSSSGPFGPTHLPTEMLQQATGTQMRHVPTNGGAPAMNMLVGGHVDLFFTVPALAMQFVEAGKLRPLVGSGDKRIAELPAVPTLKELGVDLEYAVWAGVFMQKSVPAGIRKTIEDAVAKIAADPTFQAAVAKTGSTLAYQNAADFQAWWEKDSAAMDTTIKKIAATTPPQ
jgi:tripartite-type tricarboxylate transporter receptor subunit TctC